MMLRISEWIDRGVARAVGFQPFFQDGWGNAGRLADLIERTSTFDTTTPVEIDWEEGHQRLDGLHFFEGSFPSPDTSLGLPPESRTANVQMLLPEEAFEGGPPPMCVHLAGSGDATYVGRRLLATPLARDPGIGAIILQNPYYGERAPEEQSGTQIRTLADHLAMNIATIEEARSLLDWLRRDGYKHVGITGYSMGGLMAALTAQFETEPLAVVPCATANSPVATLLDSPLRRAYDWRALDAQLEEDDSATVLVEELMSEISISRQGELAHPEFAVIVGGIRDQFVPPAGVLELHRHWPGSELRWIDAGHTTGWALHHGEIREAIAAAFERLMGAD